MQDAVPTKVVDEPDIPVSRTIPMPPKGSLIRFDTGHVWVVTSVNREKRKAVIKPATMRDLEKQKEREVQEEALNAIRTTERADSRVEDDHSVSGERQSEGVE